MKIVILGANGQLGRQLCGCLPGDIVTLCRADADLATPVELRQTLHNLRPDVVVNAAGFTQVDRAEAETEAAFAVNAQAVRDLATICRDADFTLLHFSTDYVFGADAQRSAPYRETDAPGPINVYGHSKLLGENLVRSICHKHFIVRTCGLYATDSVNFVTTMLRKAEEGGRLEVVDDQICTPTSAAELAQAIGQLLDSAAYGLYHVTNAGACSWHEFARTIFELTQTQVSLIPIKSEQYAAPASRPHYSVLDNQRWIDRGFKPLVSWQEALERVLTTDH